jgi:hypothetical protein
LIDQNAHPVLDGDDEVGRPQWRKLSGLQFEMKFVRSPIFAVNSGGAFRENHIRAISLANGNGQLFWSTQPFRVYACGVVKRAMNRQVNFLANTNFLLRKSDYKQ